MSFPSFINKLLGRAAPVSPLGPFMDLGAGWWIGLPATYRSASEGDATRVWKPGRTVMLLPPQVCDATMLSSERGRLLQGPPGTEPAAVVLDERVDGIERLGWYRPEGDGDGVPCLSALAWDGACIRRVVLYFDLHDDLEWAKAVVRSLGKAPPAAVDPLVDRLHADGWLVLAEPGVALSALTIAERDPPDNAMDSGWRLWRPSTPDDRAPRPIPLAQLLAEAPSARALMGAPVGSLWDGTSGRWVRVR